MHAVAATEKVLRALMAQSARERPGGMEVKGTEDSVL
jgi:hypothetical protein